MTWTVSRWPTFNFHWVGRMSCDQDCDAYHGDTPCYLYKPILCINYYKSMARPDYPYSANGSMNPAYYHGWTGGVFTVTHPVKGSDITSQAYGDMKCQAEFG